MHVVLCGSTPSVAERAKLKRLRRARFNLYEIVSVSKNVEICTILTHTK